MKKALLVIVSVVALSACGSANTQIDDPAQDEKNYKTCLSQGGSFSKTEEGFSCTFIK